MVTKESSRKSGGEKFSQGNKSPKGVGLGTPKGQGKKRKAETVIPIKTENSAQEGGKMNKKSASDDGASIKLFGILEQQAAKYKDTPYSKAMEKIDWEEIQIDDLKVHQIKGLWNELQRNISKERTLLEVVVRARRKFKGDKILAKSMAKSKEVKKILNALPPGYHSWIDWKWKRFVDEVKEENPDVSKRRLKGLCLQKFKELTTEERDRMRDEYLEMLNSYTKKCNQLIAKDRTLQALVGGGINFGRNGQLHCPNLDAITEMGVSKPKKLKAKYQPSQEASEEEEEAEEGSEDEQMDEESEGEESGDSEDEEL